MKIAVIDDYQDAFRSLNCYARLKGHEVVVFNDTELDPAKLGARLKDCNAVVLTQQRSFFPRAVIEKLPATIKLIAQTGHNIHHIDAAACTERGIAIAAAGGGGSGSSTAELAWALILASRRNLVQEIPALRQGVWQTTLGTELNGTTLGVYALGKIGGQVANFGKAFGMNVMCWGREASQAKARELGYTVPASREAFFESADVISIHIPLKKETRGIITAADLARMKPTALLVNCARAGLIAEGALVEALKKGRPGFAAVDVYEQEPVIGANHPLLKLPNVLCTPHLGYVVRSSYENMYATVVDSLLGFATGKPVNIKNPEALAAR